MKGKSIESFFEAISERVYEEGDSIQNDSKYQAVNLLHEDTIEVRGLRPQTSAQHYFDMINLFQQRINYLKTIKVPIPFTGKNQSNRISHTIENRLSSYTTTVSAKKRAQVYYKYVTETGLDWNTYKNYPVDKDVLKKAKKLKAPEKVEKLKKKDKSCKVLIAS